MAKKGDIGKLAISLALDPSGVVAGVSRTAKTLVKLDSQAATTGKSFARAFDGATGSVERLGRALGSVTKIAGIGAAAIGGGALALGYFAHRQGEVLDAGGKMADSLGVATEAFFGLRLAGELSGVSAETLDANLGRLTRTLGQAAYGADQSNNAFAQLGLDARRLALMPLDRSLAVVADRIAALPTSVGKARAAFALFGRGGLSMLPLLAGGSGGLKKAMEDIRTFGWAIDRLAIARIEVLNDNITRIGWALRGIGAQLAARIAPYLAAATDTAIEWLRSIGGIPGLLDRMEQGLRGLILKGGEFWRALKIGAIDARIGFNEFVFSAQSGIAALANALIKLNNVVPWSQKMAEMEDPDRREHAARLSGLLVERSLAEVAKNPAEGLLQRWDAWAAKVREKVVSSRPKLDMRGISEDMFDEFDPNIASKQEKMLRDLGDSAGGAAKDYEALGSAAKEANKQVGSFGQGSLATVAFGVGRKGQRSGGNRAASIGVPVPEAYQSRNVTGRTYEFARNPLLSGGAPSRPPMSEAERNYRAAASYVPGFVDIWDTVGTGKNEATGLLREAVSELRQINQGQRSPARRAAAYAG